MNIGIVGTGMIGSSLAALFTGYGHETVMLASRPERVSAARENWMDIYRTLMERGLVNSEQLKACESRLRIETEYGKLSGCKIIFECVKEDRDIKFSVYRQIEAHCPDCRVIASVSSAMPPEVLQDGCVRMKKKIVTAHPFYPPHLVPFVELVRAEDTDESAAALVYDLLEGCGRKVCVMKKSAPGFIANRLQHALLREATYMVEQGMAEPADIDKALKYSFMPRYSSVGLFEHQDAAGLDMVVSIEDRLLSDLSTAQRTPDYIRQRAERGDIGQKSGRGIYEWDQESIERFRRDAAEPYWKYFDWPL